MKKKIVGILFVMLLIGTTIPVYSAAIETNLIIDKRPKISPGDYFRFIFFDMSLRSYRFHIPPCYDGSTPMPLIILIHGYSANAYNIMKYSELNKKADEEGFIVVYPNGGTDISFILESLINYRSWGRYWNCWNSYDFDDVGFIKALIEHLKKSIKIDSSNIFITGFSNGGMMAYRLGAELSDIIAAIAPVAGSIGGKWYYWEDEHLPLYIIPDPENSLPVVIIHGMKDKDVPYDGLKDPLTDEIILYSVNESVAFWVEHNNCDPVPEINISENGKIITRTYTNGSHGTEVVLYTYINRGHNWLGTSCNDLMWEFFKNHTKK